MDTPATIFSTLDDLAASAEAEVNASAPPPPDAPPVPADVPAPGAKKKRTRAKSAGSAPSAAPPLEAPVAVGMTEEEKRTHALDFLQSQAATGLFGEAYLLPMSIYGGRLGLDSNEVRAALAPGLAAHAEIVRNIAIIYGGDYAKYVPLVGLGFAWWGDAQVLAAVAERKSKKEARDAAGK